MPISNPIMIMRMPTKSYKVTDYMTLQSVSQFLNNVSASLALGYNCEFATIYCTISHKRYKIVPELGLL